MLIAIDTWLPWLRLKNSCVLQGDATAALGCVDNLAGKTTAMNAIAAEIALRLECAQVRIHTEHYKASLNKECDALSRLSQGATISTRRHKVPRVTPKARNSSYFWGWFSSHPPRP